MPKVSLIMPVFNSAQFIREAIESVLIQDYTNWELVIVDDGSIDSSLSICLAYAFNDTRIKVFTIKNSGAAKARDFAINQSTGKWLAYVDSDDYLDKNYLSSLLADENENFDLILADLMMENNGDFYSFNNAVGLYCGDVYHGVAAIRRTFPWRIHIAGLIKSDFYKKNSGISLVSNIEYNSDEYITRRLLFEGRTLVGGKSKYFYRANENSTTKKRLNIKSFQQLDVNELIINYLNENNIFDLSMLVEKNQKNVFNKLVSEYDLSELNEKDLSTINYYGLKYNSKFE